ncbi:MAG: hypothetical protein RIK87_13195 [Fuerstiella sp.]
MDRLIELMKQGHSLDQIEARLTPESEAVVMQHTALMRRLDQNALARILPAGFDAAEQLDRLQLKSDVTPVRNRDGVFAVREKVRSAHLDHWRQDTDAYRQLNGTLADYFQQSGREWELDYLHHLLAADPSAGIRQMTALLNERLPQPDSESNGAIGATHPDACDGIALGKAVDVLRVVEGQLPFLPQQFQQDYKSASRLVEAWTEGQDAWYRSRRYITRERVHAWFHDLMDGGGRQILEIHAPGGSGKTMTLRWLMAHHCIPRRRPIAHLDFDHYIGQPQQTWQLLLHCARQLNRQLAGAPLDTLIQEGNNLEESLRRPQGQNDEITGLDESRLRSFEDEFVSRFGDILNSASTEVSTIIVDTFEEAMVRGLTPVPRFLALLARLSRTCPLLRVIICGRYSTHHHRFGTILEQDYPEDSEFYDQNVRRERLPQFDEQEAGRYLAARNRTLTPDQIRRLFNAQSEITANTAQQPEISPFHLSLIADLLNTRGDKTTSADEFLQDLEQVKLIYLIERVISRIRDVTVRWLLRYGVVPRRLTREFFEQVIVPQLRKVSDGRSELDDPNKDQLPADLQETSLFFVESAIPADGTGAIWNRLCAFAGSDSWIEQHDNGDSLVFHTCVREPMRHLLRQHPVLRSIHGDAAAFFEQKAAAADAADRCAFLQEAVYHSIQLKGTDAGPELMSRLQQSAAAEDAEAVVAVAEEITRDEHRSTSDPLVEPAHYRTALQYQCTAAIDLLDQAEDEDARRRWSQIADHAATQLESIAAREAPMMRAAIDLRTSLIRSAREKALNILMQVKVDQFPSMITGFLNSLQQKALGILKLTNAESLSALIARSLSIGFELLAHDVCVSGFRCLVLWRLQNPEIASRPMTMFLAQSHARCLRIFGGTQEDYQLFARVIALPGFSEDRQISATRSIAALFQTWLRPASAAAFIRSRGHERDPELDLVCRKSEGSTAPAAAAEKLEELVTRHSRLSSTSDPAESVVPSALVNQAWYLTMLADVNHALSVLRDAAGTFARESRTAQAAWCYLMESEIWLHSFGNVRASQKALAQRQRSVHSGTDEQDPDWLRESLLEFELEARSRIDPTRYERLLEAAERSSVVDDRLRCAVTLCAVLTVPELQRLQTRIFDLLFSAFKRLPDAIARSDYPWLLRECRHRISLEPELEERLIKLVQLPDRLPELFGQPADSQDRAWAALRHAHLLRLVGRADIAKEDVAEAGRLFSERRSLTGLREVWYLQAVCGWRYPDPDELNLLRGKAPRLEAVTAVEQAEFAVLRSDFTSAEQWLTAEDLKCLAGHPSSFSGRADLICHAIALDRELPTLPVPVRYLQSARKKFDRLGDPDALLRYQAAFQKSFNTTPSPSPMITEGPDLWTIADRHRIEFRVNRNQPQEPENYWIRLLTSDSELQKNLLNAREAAPYSLVVAVAEQPGWVAGAFDGLTLDTRKSAGSGIDFCLTGDHLSAMATPWELARFSFNTAERPLIYRDVFNATYRIHWLQSALRAAGAHDLSQTGSWNPETAEALKEFVTQNRPTDDLKQALRTVLAASLPACRPRAVVLQPTEYRQQEAQRGLSELGDEERFLWLYEQHGFSCEIHHGLTLDDFAAEDTADEPPTIIHVYTSYRESRSDGTVEPDFGGGGRKRKARKRGPEFQPENPGLCSLLILDGPGETDNAEQVRQLFLRNATGAVLARDERWPNLLGIGLDQYPDTEFLQRLLAGIKAGVSLRQLYQALTGQDMVLSAETLCRQTGVAAPVLWTSDPDLSVLI